MAEAWTIFEGKIVKGLQIASGLSSNPPIKLGMTLNNTVALQKPHFEKAGVRNILKIFNGTINLDISPKYFEIVKPDHDVTCNWFENFEETFWLTEALIDYKGSSYCGYIYYPCPSEVKSHPNTIIEFLAPKIPGLSYGENLIARVQKNKVRSLHA